MSSRLHSTVTSSAWLSSSFGEVTSMMITVGSTVRFARLPQWVAQLPDESRRVFLFCLGRSYRVAEVDQHGHFVLDVSGDIDQRFRGFANDIRLEAEFLEEVS